MFLSLIFDRESPSSTERMQMNEQTPTPYVPDTFTTEEVVLWVSWLLYFPSKEKKILCGLTKIGQNCH